MNLKEFVTLIAKNENLNISHTDYGFKLKIGKFILDAYFIQDELVEFVASKKGKIEFEWVKSFNDPISWVEDALNGIVYNEKHGDYTLIIDGIDSEAKKILKQAAKIEGMKLKDYLTKVLCEELKKISEEKT